MKTESISTRVHVRIFLSGFLIAVLMVLGVVEFGTISLRNTLCRSMYPEQAAHMVYTGELAASVNASYLIAHLLAVRGGQIVSSPITPGEIIHQSWKTQDVPSNYHSLMTSWRSIYSNWTYVLWGNDENRALVEAFYPEWLSAYDALPSDIYRAYFARNLYMHAFGGIYADIDSEAVSPLNPLLEAQKSQGTPTAFLGTMKTSSHKLHGIPNAFMATSAPDHPLWLIVAQDTVDWSRARSWDRTVPIPGPEYISGPISLRRSIMNYSPSVLNSSIMEHNNAPTYSTFKETVAPVVLFSPDVIYPFTWDRPRPHISTATQECVCWMALSTFNPETCKRMTGAHWVIHYWKHTW